MTQSRREELADALRGGLPPVPAVEEMLAADITSIEPIINDIEEQAFRRGCFATYLEMAEERKQRQFDLQNMRATPVPF